MANNWRDNILFTSNKEAERVKLFMRNYNALMSPKRSGSFIQKIGFPKSTTIFGKPFYSEGIAEELAAKLNVEWLARVYNLAEVSNGFSPHVCFSILRREPDVATFLSDNLVVKREDMNLAVRLCLLGCADLLEDDLYTMPLNEWKKYIPIETAMCVAIVIASLRTTTQLLDKLGVKPVNPVDTDTLIQSKNLEIEQLSSDLRKCREEISTLKDELALCKANLSAANHRESAATKQAENAASNLRDMQKSNFVDLKKLTNENESLKLQVESLKNLVANLASPNSVTEDCASSEELSCLSFDEDDTNWTNLLPNSGVAFVGCHDNLSFKIQEVFPDWKIINYGDHGFTLSTSTKVMVLHTGYMTHSQYYRAMTQFSGTIIYVSGTNLDKIFGTIRAEIERLELL